MKALWRWVFLAAGLAFFAWYLSRVGLSEVGEGFRRLGPYLPLVLLPYLLVYTVDCLAWAQTLPRVGIPFRRLLRIRWAGESVNNVLPSAYIGGEAVKVCLLKAYGISASEGASSAVISKTAQSVAQLAFVLAASLVLVLVMGPAGGMGPGVVFVVVGGLATIAVLFGIQRLGFFRLSLGALQVLRLRWAFLEQRKAQLLELDGTILEFYRAHPRRFCFSTALYFGGWMLDTVEVYLVSHWLGLPITWPQALVVEAFTGVAKALGMWVPGSLGVQESGIVLAGRLAGVPDAFTATYPLVRRCREAVYAMVGLVLLYADKTLRPSAQTHTATP